MNTLLNKTLATIEIEATNYSKSFILVDDLLKEYGETDLANRLYADIKPEVKWELIASLFSILEWQTSDNGNALSKETEQWITDCDDERKINIAINLDGIPFINFNEMCEKLEKAKTCFPSISKQVDHLIKFRTNNNA